MGDTCVEKLGMGETWYRHPTVKGDREQLDHMGKSTYQTQLKGAVADLFYEWAYKAKERPSLSSLPWVREHRGKQGVNMCAHKSR